MKTVGNFDITGSIIQSGSDSNQFLGDVAIANSKIFKGGSTKFGDDVTDTHQFTGSIISNNVTIGEKTITDDYGYSIGAFDAAVDSGKGFNISIDSVDLFQVYVDFAGDSIIHLKSDYVLNAGGTEITSTSRLKNDIVDFSASYVDSFDQLRPVYFEWNWKDIPDYGLIAEELDVIYPEFTVKNSNNDIVGYKPGAITALLIKTVQDLRQRVADLEAGTGV